MSEMKIVKGTGLLPAKIDRILLIQLGDIGDVVLSFPCARALKERYPKSALVMAVRDKAAGLVANCPWSDGVLAVQRNLGPSEQFNFIRKLRQHHFDLAVDLRTGTRGAIMAFLSGAVIRIGYYAEDGRLRRNRLFTDLLKYDYTPDLHVVDHLLGLLSGFGIPVEHRVPEMLVPERHKKEIQHLLREEGVDLGKRLVAIQPFSLWRYKELGRENYVDLIRWLKREFDLLVLVTGGPEERKRAQAIVTECGRGCYNLAGRTSIDLYAALLAACCLFIGVDSAGLHLAAAVGIRTVGIFGPSSPISWAPRGAKHLVVSQQRSCCPCRKKGCDGKGVSSCLEELLLKDLQAPVQRQLKTIFSEIRS